MRVLSAATVRPQIFHQAPQPEKGYGESGRAPGLRGNEGNGRVREPFPTRSSAARGRLSAQSEGRLTGRWKDRAHLIFRGAEDVASREVGRHRDFEEEARRACPSPRPARPARPGATGGRVDAQQSIRRKVLRARQPGRYSQESSGTHLMVESDRQRRCARNSGCRGWFFELVMAVTSAAEGGCQRGNSAGGKGEFVPKNETSQTQRVTGRSPEQPSPKCCSRTSLLG